MKNFIKRFYTDKVKKTLLLLLLVVFAGFFACQHPKDKVVAQVYYHKLYLSQIQETLPKGLGESDSLAMVNAFVTHWIKEQLILHEAKHNLTAKEKNFDNTLEEYRNNLLINAYYDKLTADTSRFKISEKKIQSFTHDFANRYSVDKAIVKINYVKLPRHSKLIAPVKVILFDDEQRQTRKEELVKLMGDSIEYFMDDAWLYIRDVADDLPLDLYDSTSLQNQPKYLEKEDKDFHYLIVLLDYKSKRSALETKEELAAARMILLQQRKQQYINRYLDELYDKAVKTGVVIQ